MGLFGADTKACKFAMQSRLDWWVCKGIDGVSFSTNWWCMASCVNSLYVEVPTQNR